MDDITPDVRQLDKRLSQIFGILHELLKESSKPRRRLGKKRLAALLNTMVALTVEAREALEIVGLEVGVQTSLPNARVWVYENQIDPENFRLNEKDSNNGTEKEN